MARLDSKDPPAEQRASVEDSRPSSRARPWASARVIPISREESTLTSAIGVSSTKTEHEFHHTQGRVLITKTGRLKMVHDDTKRCEEWQSELLPRYVGDPIVMKAVKVDAGDGFVLQVSNEGVPPFQLDEASMTILSVDSDVDSHSPLRCGDKVVAVNGKPVSTFAEYLEQTNSVATFAVTFRPLPGQAAESGHSPSPCWSPRSVAYTSIQFDVTEVACLENVGHVKVLVRRVGNCDYPLRWRYSTKNGNVSERLFDSLHKKEQMEGDVIFEAKQDLTYIELPVPSDPDWNAESLYWAFLIPLDQAGPLSEQWGARVTLGSISHVSIYSLNLVTFPCGVYGTLDARLREDSVDAATVAWGFVKYTCMQMPSETRWRIGLSLVPPLLFYLSQIIFGFLVNCAIADRETAQCRLGGIDFSGVAHSDRFDSSLVILGLIALAKFSLTAVTHAIDVTTRSLRWPTNALRAQMFSTMLQMSDTERFKFDTGDIEKCLDTEVGTAVVMVWLRAFRLVQLVFGLVIKTILTIQIVVGLRSARETAVLLACIPVMATCAIVTFRVRGRETLALYSAAFTGEENLMAFVMMCVAATPLIRTYLRGWHFTKCFEDCHATYTDMAWRASKSSALTVNLFKYIFVIVSGIVIMVGGRQVRLKVLSAGEFLVLLKTIDSFGKDIIAAVKTSNDMLRGSAAVRKIAEVLNASSFRLESLNRDASEEASMERHAADKIVSTVAGRCADSHIELKRVHYIYPSMQVGQGYAITPLNLSLPVGELVCFPGKSVMSGGAASNLPGINTLFSLIAGRLTPTEGQVLVPRRWRIVYVPVIPIMFDGTLLYNLMFSDHATSAKLAWKICKELGLSPGLLEKADFDVGTDGQSLCFSDQVIVSIARALLHDVDVLLISSALDVLGEERALKVLRFLTTFSQRRGLASDHLPWELRDQKTILYTSKFKTLQEQASYVVRREMVGPGPHQRPSETVLPTESFGLKRLSDQMQM